MTENERSILDALAHLRAARVLLRAAEAPHATAAVQRAIKSTDGALRHARLAPYRAMRP